MPRAGLSASAELLVLQAGCPSCRPTNSVKALKGKYHIPWTCLPQAHLGVFKLCLWTLIAPSYLGGGLPCVSSALWCQYPYFKYVRCVKNVFQILYNCACQWWLLVGVSWTQSLGTLTTEMQCWGKRKCVIVQLQPGNWTDVPTQICSLIQ